MTNQLIPGDGKVSALLWLIVEDCGGVDRVSFSCYKQIMNKTQKPKVHIFSNNLYMLENGEITESGSHSELMELNGKYAEMFNAQDDKYKDNIYGA
jgi:hypothetical protein